MAKIKKGIILKEEVGFEPDIKEKKKNAKKVKTDGKNKTQK